VTSASTRTRYAATAPGSDLSLPSPSLESPGFGSQARPRTSLADAQHRRRRASTVLAGRSTAALPWFRATRRDPFPETCGTTLRCGETLSQKPVEPLSGFGASGICARIIPESLPRCFRNRRPGGSGIRRQSRESDTVNVQAGNVISVLMKGCHLPIMPMSQFGTRGARRYNVD
jgi:hypothetical protein